MPALSKSSNSWNRLEGQSIYEEVQVRSPNKNGLDRRRERRKRWGVRGERAVGEVEGLSENERRETR